jgi:hypothetical protein
MPPLRPQFGAICPGACGDYTQAVQDLGPRGDLTCSQRGLTGPDPDREVGRSRAKVPRAFEL